MLCAAVVASAGAIGARSSSASRAGAAIGPWVAAAVLVAIGVLNLVAARDLRAWRKREPWATRTRSSPSAGAARRWWRGRRAVEGDADRALFGLGLDTATEIALLTLTALRSPAAAALVLPLLFAGMALVDSLNGC